MFLAIIFKNVTEDELLLPITFSDVKKHYQLRIYELFDSNYESFYIRFKEKAIPIMERYGFTFMAYWTTRNEGSPYFLYLLQWDTISQSVKSWDSFLKDKEWLEIKKQSFSRDGPMVGSIQDMQLTELPWGNFSKSLG